MKIALINDIHIGIKNDAIYMLDYQKKFFDQIFFPILEKEGIKTILVGGDVFDRRKYINFKTLSYAREFLFDKLNRFDTYVIPGNHDVANKNNNEVNSIELLLKEYKNITYIATPTTLEFDDNCKIDMLPWINNENHKDVLKFIQDTTSEILYGHLELAGFEMYAGVKNEHGMAADLFKKFKEVWSGHFHHKSDKGNIKYLGAPMEFTFADADDPRGFHVYDTQTKQLTYHQNPFKMYEKIYYNDESDEAQDHYRNVDTSVYAHKAIKMYVVRKTKPALFEFFVEKLFQEEDVKMVIHEDFSEFHEDNIDLEEIKDQSTKDLMEMYIDGVETDMNKKKLKSIINSIYIEALNVGHAGHI